MILLQFYCNFEPFCFLINCVLLKREHTARTVNNVVAVLQMVFKSGWASSNAVGIICPPAHPLAAPLCFHFGFCPSWYKSAHAARACIEIPHHGQSLLYLLKQRCNLEISYLVNSFIVNTL